MKSIIHTSKIKKELTLFRPLVIEKLNTKKVRMTQIESLDLVIKTVSCFNTHDYAKLWSFL